VTGAYAALAEYFTTKQTKQNDCGLNLGWSHPNARATRKSVNNIKNCASLASCSVCCRASCCKGPLQSTAHVSAAVAECCTVQGVRNVPVHYALSAVRCGKVDPADDELLYRSETVGRDTLDRSLQLCLTAAVFPVVQAARLASEAVNLHVGRPVATCTASDRQAWIQLHGDSEA
jgi:hypothetical protein